VERLLTRRRQSLVPHGKLQQCRTHRPTIPPALPSKARSGYTSRSRDRPPHLPHRQTRTTLTHPRERRPARRPQSYRSSPECSGSPRREMAHASMKGTGCTDDRWQIHLGEKEGQAGTHNSPGDRENKVSPTTTTGDRRWKRTQERTGHHNNNLGSERPEGPRETS